MSAKKEEQKQFVDGRCAIAELLPYQVFCPRGIPRVVHVVNKLGCHFVALGKIQITEIAVLKAIIPRNGIIPA